MSDHYEQLGVDPDASPDEIKRAYRAKAREHHPDKGGSADEFAPVANAYEVLSDPERRLLYDATGQDTRLPIEKEVETALIGLFHEALSQPEDIEVVKYVREKVKQGKLALTDERKRLKTLRKKLLAKRDRIKSKSEVNLVHLIIDGEIRGIDGMLAQVEHKEKVGEAMLTALKEYSEELPKVKVLDLRRNPYAGNPYAELIRNLQTD